MKSRRWEKRKISKIMGTLVMCVGVLILVAYSMQGMFKQETTGDLIPVSVIVSDSAGDKWTALRQGLEQASKDYHIELNFVSTSDFHNAKEEKDLIEREIENGAKGILYQTTFGGTSAIENLTNTPVFLLETDVEPQEIYAVAQLDHKRIGSQLAQALKDTLGQDLEKTRIGILCGNQSVLSNKQRLEGLIEALPPHETNYVWMLSTGQQTLTEKLEAAGIEQRNLDVLIALNNDDTELAVDYVLEQNSSYTQIYGVGTSEKLIYYLDQGMIADLIVPLHFQMGYQAMEQMAKYLTGSAPRMESVTVGNLVVDKERLYDDENQKIIFPNVQ